MKHGKELPVAIPDISNSRVCVHICVFMFGESNKKKKKSPVPLLYRRPLSVPFGGCSPLPILLTLSLSPLRPTSLVTY